MTIAAPESSRLPRAGDVIAGKYVLERLLGQGGMGAVFAAKHIKLSKSVAIKIMLADASNPEASQRFINEGRAAANIQSEHVVRVDDVDEERGYAYMVLELLDGEDLGQLIERDPTRRLRPHVAVGYVLEALEGVMQAHAIGIVHRDLKPSNLFLAKRKDGSVVVKVLDFGISKTQGSSALAASPSALTSTKAMLGSPLYMSPEQLRSSKSVDPRADIWAVGVILYELTTGRLPFLGDSLGELFANILETDPAPLRTFNPEVSPGLEGVVLRCLQRRVEHRFQTASELAHALAPFATTGPELVAASPLGGTALLPPGAARAPSAAITPGAPFGAVQPLQPSSGPHVAALGGVTPQPQPQPAMQQTESAWQRTGAGATSGAKTSAVVAVAIGAFVLLASAGAAIIMKSKPSADPSASASITAPPDPSFGAPPAATVAAPPPDEPLPVATTLAPVTAASPSASATATTSAGPTVKGAAPAIVAGSKAPKQPSTQAKVEPPKPVAAPSPTPSPVVTARPTSGNLQNSR